MGTRDRSIVVTTLGDEGCSRKRGLADADYRDFRHRAGGIKSGVVKTGNDCGICSLALATRDLDQHAGHSQRLVRNSLRSRPAPSMR
jgi:hypothetical protein